MSFTTFVTLLSFSGISMAACVYFIIRSIRMQSKIESENENLKQKVSQDEKTINIFAQPSSSKSDIIKRMRKNSDES